jgi:hypothetical protein
MKQFMYLFRGGTTEGQSPEELQEGLQNWGVWMGGLGKSGKLISGEPLIKTGKTLTKKGTIVTDGPFIEGKEIVGGYVIVSATNYDEAMKLSEGCPILDHDNGIVEVREVLKL